MMLVHKGIKCILSRNSRWIGFSTQSIVNSHPTLVTQSRRFVTTFSKSDYNETTQQEIDDLLTKAHNSTENMQQFEKNMPNYKLVVSYKEETHKGEQVYACQGHYVNNVGHIAVFTTIKRYQRYLQNMNIDPKDQISLLQDASDHIDGAARSNSGLIINAHSENSKAWSPDEVKSKLKVHSNKTSDFRLYDEDKSNENIKEVTLDKDRQFLFAPPREDLRLPEIEKEIIAICRKEPLVRAVSISFLIAHVDDTQFKNSYCMIFAMEDNVSEEKIADIVSSTMQKISHLWPSTQPEASKGLYKDLIGHVHRGDSDPDGTVFYRK